LSLPCLRFARETSPKAAADTHAQLFPDALTAAACEGHSTAAQHRRKVGVTASRAAAIAQISAADGVVSYLGPTREGYCLSDANTK